MVKVIVFDVDGTLTDGKLYIGPSGESFKAFDVKDGYGIHDLMPKFGIIPVIITARTSSIIEKRCEELGIRYLFQGCKEKGEMLIEILGNWGMKADQHGKYCEVACMGDDLPDLPLMEQCSVTGCPADAVKEIKEKVMFVSEKNGGAGAARDFIEWIIKTNLEEEK